MSSRLVKELKAALGSRGGHVYQHRGARRSCIHCAEPHSSSEHWSHRSGGKASRVAAVRYGEVQAALRAEKREKSKAAQKRAAKKAAKKAAETRRRNANASHSHGTPKLSTCKVVAQEGGLVALVCETRGGACCAGCASGGTCEGKSKKKPAKKAAKKAAKKTARKAAKKTARKATRTAAKKTPRKAAKKAAKKASSRRSSSPLSEMNRAARAYKAAEKRAKKGRAHSPPGGLGYDLGEFAKRAKGKKGVTPAEMKKILAAEAKAEKIAKKFAGKPTVNVTPSGGFVSSGPVGFHPVNREAPRGFQSVGPMGI